MIESCSVSHELFVPIFGQGGYPQRQGHCQHLVEQFPESCNKRKPILVHEETENIATIRTEQHKELICTLCSFIPMSNSNIWTLTLLGGHLIIFLYKHFLCEILDIRTLTLRGDHLIIFLCKHLLCEILNI